MSVGACDMSVACRGVLGRLLLGRDWGKRFWARVGWLLAAVFAVVATMLVVSASAWAVDCSLADYAYNAARGPEYESPGWGDAAGWTDPSQYSTIKLADITGNGQDELIARNSDGLEIWRFDTSVGQWRPAIGANGVPEVLRDFRSPLPSEPAGSHGANPMVYGSIQTADVLGNGTESIVAQFPDGVHTYDYAPPAGINSIDGGSWHQEPVGGPTGTGQPSEYLSLHAVGASASLNAPGTVPATLVDQGRYWVHQASGGWAPGSDYFAAPSSQEPRYYLNTETGVMPRRVTSGTGVGTVKFTPVDVWRTASGVDAEAYDNQPGCSYSPSCHPVWLDLSPLNPGSVNPFPDKDNSTVYQCEEENFSCFGDSPSWYETMRLANHLLGPNDNDGYVLGRLNDGLHAYGMQPNGAWDTFPVLTALRDPPTTSAPPSEWSTIRTGDITGDGHTDVVDLVDGQLRAWELKASASGQLAWSELPANPALNLGPMWENNASYYSTIQVGPVAGPGYPDAVIARGPFGIRTWFYCTGGQQGLGVPGCDAMQGKSGWTSWLPQHTSSLLVQGSLVKRRIWVVGIELPRQVVREHA
jgi:hypothetical protein